LSWFIVLTLNIISGLQMGKTQVFLRAPVFELLERLHLRALTVIAKRLQRRRRAKILYVEAGRQFTAKTAAAEAVMLAALNRREKARKCVSATLVLQRRIRVFLAVCKRKCAIKGFTKLKAQFRGYKARLYVAKLKYNAARKIQANYRCYSKRIRYVRMKKATIVAQAIIRMHLARVTRIKKTKLVRLLQRLWRGTMARIETFVMRQKIVSVVDVCATFL
jgi:myosin heavy subunit